MKAIVLAICLLTACSSAGKVHYHIDGKQGVSYKKAVSPQQKKEAELFIMVGLGIMLYLANSQQ